MQLRATPILLIALVALASCVGRPSECAGWRLVTLAPETVDYLAENDPQALREVIAHAEFGRANGCW